MSGIIDFTVAEKVNPYTQAVAELAEAGEGKGFEIVCDTKEAGKNSLAFRKAANAIDKTARRYVTESDPELGTIRMVFTLTHKHAARRGQSEAEVATQSVSKGKK
jgi:hypothetical protein